MITKKVVVLVLLSVGLSSGAMADTSGLSKQFSACMNKANSTPAMIDCMGVETKQQDVRLNKYYKEVMAGLTPERKKQLQEVQRTWLKYRELNCAFYADPDGGSMARVSANDCFMSATAARAKELEDMTKSGH